MKQERREIAEALVSAALLIIIAIYESLRRKGGNKR